MMVTQWVIKCCLLSCQKTWVIGARLRKTKEKEKGLRTALLNDESPYLEGMIQDEQGRESGDKGKDAGEKGTGCRSFWPPVAPHSLRHTHTHTRINTHNKGSRQGKRFCSSFIYPLVTSVEVLRLPTFTRILTPQTPFTLYSHRLI